MHYTRNTFSLYDYEWTCIACGYNVVERINESTKIQREKNFYY